MRESGLLCPVKRLGHLKLGENDDLVGVCGVRFPSWEGLGVGRLRPKLDPPLTPPW